MNKHITILFFILFSTTILSQKGEIIYKPTFHNTIEDNSEIGKKVRKEFPLMQFSLKYDKERSYFELIPYIAIDPLSSRIATIISGVQESWYQDFSSKESYFNKKIGKKKYVVIYENKMTGWQLTNESKKIEDYTCYKAMLKQYSKKDAQEYFIEAWYSPEIPASYGPAGYGGLPGLILELKYGEITFVAKKLVFNPKRIKYPQPNMENPINKDELVKLMRKVRKVTKD